MKKKETPQGFLFSFSAEDEGFKPPIRGKAYTGFRVQRIRSLCQSSLVHAPLSFFSACKINEFFLNGKIIL